MGKENNRTRDFPTRCLNPLADPQFLVETANVKFQGDNIVMEWIGNGHVKDVFIRTRILL